MREELVNVKRFDAKGDGRADDTAALLAALQHSLESGTVVYLPAGTYMIEPNRIKLSLKEGQRLRVKGDGTQSVIKRKEWTTAADWKILIAITTDASNKEDVDLVRFSDFKLDGNARKQQQPPADPYDFEHCADICIYGSETSYIRQVEMKNMYADDGVADHLYIAGMENAYVKHLEIDGFTVDSRSRMRSDICVTGGIETARIRNVDCKSLEYEFNEAYEKGMSRLKLENIRTDNLDLTGANMDLEVEGNNIISGHTYLGDLVGQITNSILAFEARNKLSPDEGRLYNLKNFTFSNSIIKVTPVNKEIVAFRITHENTILFKNISFVIDDPAAAFKGCLIDIEPTDAKGTYIEFNQCAFDERASTGLRFNRCGNIAVKNAAINNPNPFRFYSSAELQLSVRLSDISLGKKCENSFLIEGGEGLELNVRGFCCRETSFGILADNSSWSSYESWSVERAIQLTGPLKMEWLAANAPEEYVILSKGDTFVYHKDGSHNPKVWEVTETDEYRLSKPISAIRMVK